MNQEQPLIESTPPRKLYKYVNPDRIDILNNRLIKFTRASAFNDPFELFPTLDAYFKPLVKARLLQQMKEEHRERMIKALDEYVETDSLRMTLRYQLEKDLQDDDSDSVNEILRSINTVLREITLGSDERREIFGKIRETLDKEFVILSLTELSDNILMWSHYADSHKGFILEFDTSDPFFDRRTFPADPLRCVRKVRYQPVRPSPALFHEKYWLRSPKTANTDIQTYIAGLLLLTKSIDWEYESEWRMIVPASWKKELIVDTSGNEHLLFELPPSCISGIILGSSVSDSVRNQIKHFLNKFDFLHVELRHAQCDLQSYRIIIKDDVSVLENKLLVNIATYPGEGVSERVNRLKVSGPRFYEAVNNLTSAGYISAPSYDRSKKGKRLLSLTSKGQAKVKLYREALQAIEKSRKSPESFLIDNILESPEQANRLLGKYFIDSFKKKTGPLTGLDDPKIRAAFAKLGDDDEDVHWRAANTLQKIGDADLVEDLVSILRSREYEELVWIQNPRQRKQLTADEIDDIESDAPFAYEVLENKRWWGSDEIIELAVYALSGMVARITTEEAVEPLIDALRDPNENIRCLAADALGKMGSKQALEALSKLAANDKSDSSYGLVSEVAIQAIRKIKKQR